MNDVVSPVSGRFPRLRSALCGIAGVVLLWIGLPRSSPVTLDNVQFFDLGRASAIALAIEPFGFKLTMRPSLLVAAMAILAALLIVHAATTFAPVRMAVQFLRRNRVAAITALAWGTLFSFTLIPGKTWGVEPTWPVAFGLVWNLLGFAALGMALAPVFSAAMRAPRIRHMISTLFDAVHRAVYRSPSGLFVGALSLFVLVAASTASGLLFGHIPHIQDSIAQLFHAKIFATGHLTAPIPAHPEFFTYTHMIMDGGWYSQFPPGHSAILFLGVLAGVPWLVNPLLGAGAIVVIYLLGRELYDGPTARLAALLCALSPFVIFMSSEFMNHASGMLMFSLFALSFFVAARRPTLITGALVGSSLGWLIAIRPYSAAALAAPFLIYGLILAWKGGAKMRRAIVAACVMLGVFMGLLLLFNNATNGDPLLSGYEKKYGTGTNPGFGHSGWGETHTPLKGMQQTFSNLNMLNKSLFEWPVPALLFCAFLFASGSQNRRDYFLLLPPALICVAYFFYWFQDLCFGPRYLYESTPLIVLLTARGIRQCVHLVRKGFGGTVEQWKISCAVGGVVLTLFVVGWSANLPPVLNEYGDSYWRVSPRLVEEVRKVQLHRAVVFVSGNFGSAFPQNDPFLEGDIIYAKDLGPDNTLLMQKYPNRVYYAYRREVLYRLR